MTEEVTQVESGIPTIALVGRVNVGKSTLFNKLIEEQRAIVSTVPGTTRTSNVGKVMWRGIHARLVDTGGLTFEDNLPLEEDIMKQSEKAMKEADLIVFVTDAKDGVLPQEKELAKRLRRIVTKPVFLVANKVDTERIEKTLTEPDWYKLGLGEPFPVSATNGRNIGDLLDRLFALLATHGTSPQTAPDHAGAIRISVIGKPNVGKSSLFNKLIGEEAAIVSDMPHTTREPYNTLVSYNDQLINFVDTAGIRRKTKVEGKLEREGISKSIDSLEHSDIILFVIDGSQPISSQDMQLGGLLERHSKSVIIILNKWDLAEESDQRAQTEAKKIVYAHFPHLSFAEILLVSGKTGFGVHKIFPLIIHIWKARHTNVPQETLALFLKNVTQEHRPARGKGTRHPKLLGIRQINEAPPIFDLLVKYRTSLHRSYVKFLENRLREQFDFTGTPIVIKLTKTKRT